MALPPRGIRMTALPKRFRRENQLISEFDLAFPPLGTTHPDLFSISVGSDLQ